MGRVRPRCIGRPRCIARPRLCRGIGDLWAYLGLAGWLSASRYKLDFDGMVVEIFTLRNWWRDVIKSPDRYLIRTCQRSAIMSHGETKRRRHAQAGETFVVVNHRAFERHMDRNAIRSPLNIDGEGQAAVGETAGQDLRIYAQPPRRVDGHRLRSGHRDDRRYGYGQDKQEKRNMPDVL